ncbi:MAG: protein translocase subunit SecF [Theionarchaea archaeon]|nr:protein translocase subunit SecF [Theionarchaea archaeon]
MTMLQERLEEFDPTQIPSRRMIGIPLIVLTTFLIIAGIPQFLPDYTGPLKLRLGMDLQGGTLAVVTGVDVDPSLKQELEDYFDTFGVELRSTEMGTAIEAPAEIDLVELENFIKERYPSSELSTSYIGPTMGEDLQEQARNALIVAFIGMTIVVFIAFRSPLPSIVVIISALSDMAMAVGFMVIFGVALELGTVAALLMVIGYSVDSNILLTTKLLKRRGSIKDKVRGAMSTGITMTFTTIAAVFSLYIISTHPVLDSIAVVLLFALCSDLMNTWMLNAGILTWYLKRRGRR